MADHFEIELSRLMKSDENLEQIKQILAGGTDPNYRMQDGRTPLHVAALSKHENTEIVEEFINSGANVHLYDNMGETPLHYAARRHNLEIVEILLECGAHVNDKSFEGETPLHMAVKGLKTLAHSDLSALETLLDHDDIDCDVIDYHGNTPLMIAVKDNREKAVELLLDKKANPNIPDIFYNTALHIAFDKRFEFICFDLLRVGADIYSVNADGKSPLDIFFEKMNPTDPLSTAPTYLKFIAFRYRITEDVKEKLERFPELLRDTEKWCEEVYRMRHDFIIYNISFHDFILKCYKDPANPEYPEDLVLEIRKRMIERFVMGWYPEYFMELFVTVPASTLREVLLEVVDGRKNSKWRNEPKLFSNTRIAKLLSCYLPRLDVFCLIFSLSNVRIPESMLNLRTTRYS